MKEKIKNIFQRTILKLFPELNRLLLFLPDAENLRSVNNNNRISNLAKLDTPYRMYNSSIGDYSYISVNSKVSFTTIGKFCSIGPGFLCGWGIHPTNGISTSPSFYSARSYNGLSFADSDKIEERKPIYIGNDVFIGANVIILDGVSIADGAIIAAGAVVTKNIPPYAIVAGVPADIIKYRFDEKSIEALLKIQWWDWDTEKLKDVEKHYFDIQKFIDLHSNE